MHTMFLRLLLPAISVLWLTIPVLVRGASTPVNVTFPDAPSATALLNVVKDNFLGISFELSSFNTLWGESSTTIPPAMLNYLNNIRSRLGPSSPLRIRVGGNSMDESTYLPNQPSMLTFPDPNAYFNDVPVNFGPTLWDVMNTMASQVGGIDFLIGLSMLHPQTDANVVEVAGAARQALGDALDAFLLGNEPDLYSNYSIPQYISDIGNVLNDLRSSPSGNLIEQSDVGGPTICCGWDLEQVITAGLDNYSYKYYTMQHYPNNICGGPDASNTNISYFLSHANVGPFVSWNQAGVQLAKQSGVPVLLTEYNTISCGGSNISNTFAASMWAIDAGLKHAASNFSGVYLHTREYNVSYNLFDPPSAPPSDLNTSSTATSDQPGWRTGSPYYAELVLAEALSPNGSVVVDLNLNDSETNPQASVAGYGIYDGGGKDRGKLVLFNFADSGGQNQTFQIPAALTANATLSMRLLLAPSVASRTSLSWAGQSIGTIGDLQGDQVTTVTNCKAGCEVEVPGPGVAVLWVGEEAPWVGNSTVDGDGDVKNVSTGYRRAGRVEWTGLLTILVVIFGLESLLSL